MTRNPASIIIELMHRRPEGFEEIEHTADWELHVWGESLPALFEQAARGMYTLSGINIASTQNTPRISRDLHLAAPDLEALLVSFLTELVLIGEEERLGFDGFDIEVTRGELHAGLTGGRITNQEKEIKAVTFHKLDIKRENDLFTVNIVFDV